MNTDLSIFSRRTTGIVLIVGLLLIFAVHIIYMPPLTITVGASIFLFLAMLFFYKPLWGFLAIIVCRMTADFFAARFTFTITENFHLNIAALFAILLIVTSGILLVTHWHQTRHMPLIVPFALLIFFFAISYFYSIDKTTSFQETLRVLSIFAAFGGAYILTKNIPHARHTTIITIIIASTIPLFFAILQLINGTGMSDNTGIDGRLFGTFKHPNAFAAFLLILIALLTYRAFTQNDVQKHNKIFTIILLCLAIILLLLTFSRGGWIALILFFAILSAMKAPKLLFAVAGITIVLFFTSHVIHDRIEEIYNPPADSSIRWRFQQWKNAIAAWQLSPVYGYGAGTEIAIHEQEQGFYAGNPYTHNDFIKVLQETGMIGLALYLFLIVSTIILLTRKYRATKNDAKLFILIVLLLFIAEIGFGMSSNIWRSTAIQWLLWTLVASALTIPKTSHTLTKT